MNLCRQNDALHSQQIQVGSSYNLIHGLKGVSNVIPIKEYIHDEQTAPLNLCTKIPDNQAIKYGSGSTENESTHINKEFIQEYEGQMGPPNLWIASFDGSTILNYENEVDFETYDFDDIIEYDPQSDDEVMNDKEEVSIDQENLESAEGIISIEAYKDLEKVLDRFKQPVIMEAVVESGGAFEIKKVASGSSNKRERSKNVMPASKSGTGLGTQLKSKSGSCDKNKLIVQTSDQSKNNKKLCCPFCLKLQSKLARHITTVHKDESDVQEVQNIPKGSKERWSILNMLKNKGNNEFNTDTKLNNGQLIVSRRPNPKFQKDGSDFSTCHVCLGTYAKTSTRHHKCSRKTIKGDRSSISLSRLVEGRVHTKASETLKIVLSKLKDDYISALIKYDWLLIVLGNELCEQYDVPYQHNMIRSRLRLLSRVLYELKKNEPQVTDFASIYNPRLCDSVIEAIRTVGGFDPVTRLFSAPHPASNAVTQVKRVGRLLKDESIANNDKQLKEQIDDFIFLFTSRAAHRILKLVANTLAKMKREKNEILPTTDDIGQLAGYLSRKRKEYFELLNEGFSDDKWVNLQEVTMASMMLFSRRRVGEMQNCIVSDYLNREKRTEDSRDQQFLALTAEGKQRVQKYSRMWIRGKLNTPVPVLLNHDVERCMDLVLKYRESAGISSSNQLLFALPASDSNQPKGINASSVMVDYSKRSGAVCPKTLRGTKFRKHFATFVGNKELSDRTTGVVATFMGHSEVVHKNFYRGNTLDREIVKMSELLEEATGGEGCYPTIGEVNVENGTEATLVQVKPTSDHSVKVKIASKRKREPEGGEGCYPTIGEVNVENGTEATLVQVKPTSDHSVKVKIASKRKREPEAKDEIVAKRIHRPRYTIEEKSIITKVFRNHIDSGTIPSINEIQIQQQKYPAIKTRAPLKIRNWISNHIRGKLSSRVNII